MTPEYLKWYKNHKNRTDWTQIAREVAHPKITRAHVRKMIVFQWEPQRDDLRVAFGWSPLVTVTPVNGAAVPSGSQVLHAQHCTLCNRPFISNHPRRQKCFICSPYRGAQK